MSKDMQLGDAVEKALTTVGITKERAEKVFAWLGLPCGCSERQEKLNQLGRWASRIASGKTEKAETYLNQIIDETQ